MDQRAQRALVISRTDFFLRIDAKAVWTLLISSSTLGTDHLRTYPPSKEHFGRSEASRSVPDHPGGSRGSQPVSAGLERSRASRAVSSVSSVSRAKIACLAARKTRTSPRSTRTEPCPSGTNRVCGTRVTNQGSYPRPRPSSLPLPPSPPFSPPSSSPPPSRC